MAQLIIEGSFEFDATQLEELMELVTTQNSTDKDRPGEYKLYDNYGTYKYVVDENYNIILLEVLSW